MIAENEVHIWQVNIKDKCGVANIIKYLSKDEVMRAATYKLNHERYRYIYTKYILKIILASYLETTSENIEFCYNDCGKPYLKPDNYPQKLYFNVSHSNGSTIFGISADNIGIDIEYFYADLPFMEISRSFFCMRETEYLESLPEKNKLFYFYKLWTRKEAIIKACGSGLREKNLNINLISDHPLNCYNSKIVNNDIEWYVTDIMPEYQYIGAIATQRPICHIKYFNIDKK